MKSLAVTYRPQTWNEVTEQDIVIDILNEQLKTNTWKQNFC